MKGYKTWLAAMGAIAYGIGGFIVDSHGPDEAIKLILAGGV